MGERAQSSREGGDDPAWHAQWRSAPRTTPRWLIRLELALIALLVIGFGAVLVGGWRLDGDYDEATYLLSELDELDRAGARWAEAQGAEAGTRVTFAEVQPHIRPPSRQLAKRGHDPLGHEWPAFRVGEGFHPRVAPASWDTLTPVLGEAFWEPYRRGEGEPPTAPREGHRPPQHD